MSSDNDNFLLSDFDEKKKDAEKKAIDDDDQVKKEGGADVTGAVGPSSTHEVLIPQSMERPAPGDALYAPVFPTQPIRSWPFTLDPFQRTAIACLERRESVLVSAHTSAGKTVVAEYAIAMALKEGQRVVYTSPIKALSNQKYRELQEEFNDVGLLTGDISINATASCLVMTTEILRSMLYRGSEVMKEVAWVVFDEVHYIRDRERGVVWEETIILLPDSVRFVFLSATIPNAREFAGWISSIHNQICHVVYTDYRPTPLQHYIFPAGGDGLHLVVDEQGRFRESNFEKAVRSLTPASSGGGRGQATKRRRTAGAGAPGARGGASDIFKMVKMIMERNYEPLIVFSFSKKECEAYALQLSKLDFNSEDEKELIEQVFANAIDRLSDVDKQLPQVAHILPLLLRGIGIHHGGLLPLLKEVIEILFQEGLLKALFATETFSIGLNMPAKTVVFSSVRKFDGRSFRTVSSGEYIQMSGRAGRRGKDDRGIVIMMIDEKLEPADAKAMVKGQSDALLSQFYLGYNMLLNLMRVEEIDPQYLIQRSFNQYQSVAAVPAEKERLARLQAELESIDVSEDSPEAQCYLLQQQYKKLQLQVRKATYHPTFVLPFLQPGRLIHATEKLTSSGDNGTGGDSEIDWGWGVLVNMHAKPVGTLLPGAPATDGYIVDVLLGVTSDSINAHNVRPAPLTAANCVLQVIPLSLSLIDGLSSVRVYIPNDLRSVQQRETVRATLNEVHRRFPSGPPLLDPEDDMGIVDAEFRQLSRKAQSIQQKLNAARSEALLAHKSNEKSFNAAYERYERRQKLEQQCKLLKRQLKRAEAMILREELKAMKRVLRRLNFTTEDDVIDTKGRVACEISAGNELLLTELIFNGVFNDLSPQHTAALLSVFVWEEKGGENMPIPVALEPKFRKVQETARQVGTAMQDSKIDIDLDEFVNSFKPSMLDVVLSWASGATFAEICKKTDVFEGSIIRCLRRLEELIRQLCVAARTLTNSELESRFVEASALIKRDIAFSASLYL